MFIGGFTLEAAEAVCGLDALDGIASLVEHSLLTSRDGRFAMLETVREYAHDLLESGGRLDDARRAHARHFGEVFEDGESGLESATMGEWLDRMDADRDNVRAAIAFAAADGDAAVALVLCAAVWRYWIWRGSLVEGRELVTAALALAATARPRCASGRSTAPARWSRELGDFAGAKELLEESLELARELDDGYRAARVGSNLGTLALFAADFDEAIAHYAESVAYMRALDDPRALSLVVQNLGIAHHGAGNHKQAIELLTESLDLARISKDPAHTSSVLRTLGRFLLDRRRRRRRGRRRAPARGDGALLRGRRAARADRDVRDAGRRRRAPRRPAHRRAADRRRVRPARGGRRHPPARRGGLHAGRRGAAARGARRGGVQGRRRRGRRARARGRRRPRARPHAESSRPLERRCASSLG